MFEDTGTGCEHSNIWRTDLAVNSRGAFITLLSTVKNAF
jgi:hypothetical protein